MTGVTEISSTALDASSPAIAMAPNGTTVVLWSQNVPENDVRYNERTPAGTWLPDPKIASPTGVVASSPVVAMDGGGTAVAVWNATSGSAPFLQAGVRPAGGTFPGAFRDLTSSGGFNKEIAMNRAGDAIITYSGSMSELIGSVRRSRSGAFSGVIPAELKPVSSTSSTALSNEGVGIDDEGNATGIWTRNLVPPTVWAVAVGALDAAAPTLSSSVPPGGTAGIAVPMAAAATDRLTPVSLSWAFGDGTTGTGGALSHIFGAAGAFNVNVTATDAVGNAATQTHPVLVAAPPPAKKKRITSRVRVTWGVAGKRIFLLRMQIGNVPKGAKAELRCADKKKGKQCPFKRTSSKKRKKGTITLFKEVKAKNVIGKQRRTFHAGQTLQVRITKKAFIGKVVRYKLEKGKIPSGKNLCLRPGAKKPRKRC